jgi:hypothetical protein
MRKAIKARAATVPITIPAIGPPPNPLFEAVEAAVVVVVSTADVGEGFVVDDKEFELETVSWPPSLVVVLSRTDTV